MSTISNGMTFKQFLDAVGVRESDIREIRKEDALNAVRQDAYSLQYVADSNQTSKICLTAVMQEGSTLEYVADIHQSPELCLTAVYQDSGAIQFVKRCGFKRE
ncbi:DUF4116 domain-containing protein [Candidatus Enterovibrio escicola]|uniref:DUF4116 domain-containing protein n=1 Tax=Candidatus Enterovibrio escicola TaxID=1927127 RepID=UPI001237FF8F|nr:DUF4116 domain-containing protein [Candidatus Enterovibrio escacola]